MQAKGQRLEDAHINVIMDCFLCTVYATKLFNPVEEKLSNPFLKRIDFLHV